MDTSPAGYPRPRDRVCVVWVCVPEPFTSAAGGRARSPALSSYRSIPPKIQNTDIVSLFNPQRLYNVCEVSQYRRCPLKRMTHVMRIWLVMLVMNSRRTHNPMDEIYFVIRYRWPCLCTGLSVDLYEV